VLSAGAADCAICANAQTDPAVKLSKRNVAARILFFIFNFSSSFSGQISVLPATLRRRVNLVAVREYHWGR
jgi:hypothetical protein